MNTQNNQPILKKIDLEKGYQNLPSQNVTTIDFIFYPEIINNGKKSSTKKKKLIPDVGSIDAYEFLQGFPVFSYGGMSGVYVHLNNFDVSDKDTEFLNRYLKFIGIVSKDSGNVLKNGKKKVLFSVITTGTVNIPNLSGTRLKCGDFLIATFPRINKNTDLNQIWLNSNPSSIKLNGSNIYSTFIGMKVFDQNDLLYVDRSLFSNLISTIGYYNSKQDDKENNNLFPLIKNTFVIDNSTTFLSEESEDYLRILETDLFNILLFLSSTGLITINNENDYEDKIKALKIEYFDKMQNVADINELKVIKDDFILKKSELKVSKKTLNFNTRIEDNFDKNKKEIKESIKNLMFKLGYTKDISGKQGIDVSLIENFILFMKSEYLNDDFKLKYIYDAIRANVADKTSTLYTYLNSNNVLKKKLENNIKQSIDSRIIGKVLSVNDSNTSAYVQLGKL